MFIYNNLAKEANQNMRKLVLNVINSLSNVFQGIGISIHEALRSLSM
mgnify:CR=1 FL=1